MGRVWFGGCSNPVGSDPAKAGEGAAWNKPWGSSSVPWEGTSDWRFRVTLRGFPHIPIAVPVF